METSSMDEYSKGQLQRLLEGLEAVRKGDLTMRLRKEREDTFGELADSYNGMVELIGGLADEVSRVAAVAGDKGNLEERAAVPGATGSWKNVVDTLNGLIDAIQTPVKEVQSVLTAMSKGDLTTKIALEKAVGDFKVMAETVNKTVDDLNRLATEVSRVARVAGTEGKLTERATVEGVAGSWKDIVDTLNALIESIAKPVLEVRRIMAAISEGDLTQKVQIETAGDIKVLADVINKTVDDLNRLAGEVSRVAKVAGVEGKLSERATVEGVKGSWKDIVDTLNTLLDSIVGPVQEVGRIVTAVAEGDLTQKVTIKVAGDLEVLAGTINDMVDSLNALASEVARVAKEVGAEGKLGVNAEVSGVGGSWKNVVDNLNGLVDTLTAQVREIAKVSVAISKGDLTQKVEVRAAGEVKALADAINGMVDDLNRLAGEVSRVARVAGEEGKLTERATVEGVAGSWKDIVDTLNALIEAIATPVLEVSRIATAISKGDLTQKVAIATVGDIKDLAETINKMVDDLNRLATEVSRVARVAGEEGNLAERASVPGVSGSWKGIVDTLNGLIDAIVTPIREVQRVLVAMSEGDLTQKVALEKAAGDFKAIGDTINQTVGDLGALIGKSGVTAERVLVGADQVASSSTQVNAALRQVADIVGQVAEGAQTQSKRLEESTKVVADLSASIQQGAVNARSAADTTAEAAKLAGKGTEAGKEAAFRLKSIDEIVRVNTGTVQKVDESAQEVTGIVGTINDIADQTNLLALNAAIEAARAGEAGRGFAVVADEVRKLAERSKTATGEIEGLVGDVRNAAGGAVAGMTRGGEQVGESLKIVDSALSVLDQISAGAQEITAKAQEISAASQQQSAGTQQVTKTVDEIASISEQNAASAQKMSASVQQQIAAMQQMTSSAQELSGIAKELSESMQQFKLTREAGEERVAERVSPKKTRKKKKIEVD